ncbi:MAG: hypothetical protein JNK55_00835 [Rubrivivax sp.]|nr:hypothetical protein [Rubrivivax sp.]
MSADSTPGALAFASLANLLVMGRAPESQPSTDNLEFIGRQLSVFAALRWLGMSEEMARDLVTQGRAIGASDHFVECEPQPGRSAQLVLVRRMRGNHADVYLLKDSGVSG